MAKANLLEEVGGGRFGLYGRYPKHLDRSDHDVLQRRQVWEEIESLKDHADFGAKARDFPILHFQVPAIDEPLADEFAVYVDVAFIRFFEVVDAAKQSGLA